MELLKDCLLFSLVCHPWLCVAEDNQGKLVTLSRHQVPMLLFPSSESKENDEWSIYNVLDNKFLSWNLVLPLYDRPFTGTSEGWLVTINENLSLTLHKPFAESNENTIIHLPPLFPPLDDKKVMELTSQYRHEYIFKMTIFTPDPVANPKDLIVIVIYDYVKELAYFRPTKDSTWIRVEGDEGSSYDDILHYKNKFYAITTRKGALVSFDVTDSNNFDTKLVADGIPSDNEEDGYYDDDGIEKYSFHKRYLAESFEGDLLHVKRYLRFTEVNETKMFRVFKWNMDLCKWVEIKSLGDNALFIGDNTSVSVLASDFVGCQKNSIYFTHDRDTTKFGPEGPVDLGVYNFGTGVCTRGFTIDEATIAKMKNSIYFTHDRDTTMFGPEGPVDLGVYNFGTGVCTRGFTIDEATIAKMVAGPAPIW
ncbi:hypothetical protein TorRG33x02_354550, partial [Trema orientale]